MIGSSQPSPEAAAVYSLLTIIADPKAAKERLDEYQKIRSSSEEAQEKHRLAIEELRRTTEKSRTDHAARERVLADNEGAIARAQAELKTKQKALDEATAAFNAQRAALTRAEAASAKQADDLKAALNAREKAVSEREAQLKARERDIAAREQAAEEMVKEAAASKADFDRKSTALQKALR